MSDPIEVVAEDVFNEWANDEHGQLCPIWARRKQSPKWDKCDCWVLIKSRRIARGAVAALQSDGWAILRRDGGY